MVLHWEDRGLNFACIDLAPYSPRRPKGPFISYVAIDVNDDSTAMHAAGRVMKTL